jgi:hypothetical protein
MFLVTITHNVIIVAELDLLTRLGCWHGCHVSLLGPKDKFDIKLKIIVKWAGERDRTSLS